MTRSHAAASAALLACSVLLCAASSAQVREKFFFRRCFFSSASASRHRFGQSSKPHCFPFPASRVRRRALIVSFLGVSRRTYFRRFERVQIQVLKSGNTCSVARGKNETVAPTKWHLSRDETLVVFCFLSLLSSRAPADCVGAFLALAGS